MIRPFRVGSPRRLAAMRSGVRWGFVTRSTTRRSRWKLSNHAASPEESMTSSPAIPTDGSASESAVPAMPAGVASTRTSASRCSGGMRIEPAVGSEEGACRRSPGHAERPSSTTSRAPALRAAVLTVLAAPPRPRTSTLAPLRPPARRAAAWRSAPKPAASVLAPTTAPDGERTRVFTERAARAASVRHPCGCASTNLKAVSL